MPCKSWFPEPARYYLTAFHEIAHSSSRCNRLDGLEIGQPYDFGSRAYGREELAAEMTASFLAAETNDLVFVGPIVGNSAVCLDGWLRAIRENPSMLWEASREARKACDYVLDSGQARFKARKTWEESARERGCPRGDKCFRLSYGRVYPITHSGSS